MKNYDFIGDALFVAVALVLILVAAGPVRAEYPIAATNTAPQIMFPFEQINGNMGQISFQQRVAQDNYQRQMQQQQMMQQQMMEELSRIRKNLERY